jgi:hypothetical protein
VIARSEKILCRNIGEDVKLLFQPSADLWADSVLIRAIEQILVNLAVTAGTPCQMSAPDDRHDMSSPIMSPSPLIPATFSENSIGLPSAIPAMGSNLKSLLRVLSDFTTKDHSKGTGLAFPPLRRRAQNNGFLQVEVAGPGRRYFLKFICPTCTFGTEFGLPIPLELMRPVRKLSFWSRMTEGPQTGPRILQMRAIASWSPAMVPAPCTRRKAGRQIDLLLTDGRHAQYERQGALPPRSSYPSEFECLVYVRIYRGFHNASRISRTGHVNSSRNPFISLDQARKVPPSIDPSVNNRSGKGEPERERVKAVGRLSQARIENNGGRQGHDVIELRSYFDRQIELGFTLLARLRLEASQHLIFPPEDKVGAAEFADQTAEGGFLA